MPYYPHTQLFLGTSRTIVISGPRIQVLDSNTGHVLHSTLVSEGLENDSSPKPGPVRCAAVNKSLELLATSGDDKMLKIWESEGLKLSSSRELPKKPTKIQFLRDNQTILVSDKFGDIFSYPLHPDPAPPSQADKPRRDALTSHENPSGGTLVLGHASLLTSFLLSANEQYVISADRDEHVRVSWYPQGWNIEMFCLGHERYVSAIHIPSFTPDTLISGGGDSTLKVWDWMTGKIKTELDISHTLPAFIKVRAGKKRQGDGEDGEDAGIGKQGKRRRRRRGKDKQNESAAEEGENEGDSQGEHPDPNEGGIEDSQVRVAPAEIGELVQVVHRIDTFEVGSNHYIIFNAVGATAIFTTPFVSEASNAKHPSKISSHEFRKPVIDFVVDDDGLVWTLLDGQWDENSESDDMVKVIKWDTIAEKFQEVEKIPQSPLLSSLNGKCLVSAQPDDIKLLDLYAQLSSMPKSSADELDPSADGAPRGRGKRNKKTQAENEAAATKRALGRLKNKMALSRVVEGGSGRDGDSELDGERETKRSRSENADINVAFRESEDIEMSQS